MCIIVMHIMHEFDSFFLNLELLPFNSMAVAIWKVTNTYNRDQAKSICSNGD